MKTIVNFADSPLIERQHARQGTFRMHDLLHGPEGTSGNFFLQLARTYDNFYSPRHRHNFDQIRVQLEGTADFDRDGEMSPGTVGYFPEGVHYGPQSITNESFTLVLQFGGASRSGYISEATFQAGVAKLKASGTFDKGIYKTTKADGSVRSRDAYEAVWEDINGRPLKYPENRYQKPVFLEPGAFVWRESNGRPGVARRHLLTASEDEVQLAQWKLEPGAQITIENNTIVFVLDGEGSSDGRAWAKWSTLYSGETQGQMEANTTVVLFEMRLARLFSAAHSTMEESGVLAGQAA
jgi:hypothetical protein